LTEGDKPNETDHGNVCAGVATLVCGLALSGEADVWIEFGIFTP
jgi:hypothetical protein